MNKEIENQHLKNNRQLNFIFIVFMLSLFSNLRAQTITMSFPQSTTYVNSIPVVWTISPSTTPVAEITLTFTYTTGFYSALSPVYVLKLKSTATSGRFTLQPLTIKTDTINFVNPPSQMLDGSYTVRMTYKRSSDNATFNSGTASITSSSTTLPPIINSPVNNQRVKQQIPLNYKLSSTPSFSGYPVTIRMLGSPDTANIKMSSATTVNTQLDARNLASNTTYVRTLTGNNSLSDGNYKMILSYFDSYNHPPASDTLDIIIDTHTDTPIVSLPLNNHTYGLQLPINFTLPELPLTGSAKLIFDDGTSKDSLTLKNINVGQNSFTLDLHNLLGSSFVQSASHNRLNGTSYSLQLKYQDTLVNTVASTQVNSILIDNSTQAPVLSSPINNSIILKDSLIHITFTLPEVPLANSLKAILFNEQTIADIGLNFNTTGQHTIQINPDNIASNPSIISTSVNKLKQAIYKVKIMYRDTCLNSASVSDSNTLIIDYTTLSPQFISPNNSTSIGNTLDLAFKLQELPLNNMVKLKLKGCTDIEIDLQTSGVGLQNFSLNKSDLLHSTGVIHATQNTIPQGNYTLMLIMKDTRGNAAAIDMRSNISF
jgi:hypothetical protein